MSKPRSGLGNDDDFGSLGRETLLYYVITSTFAILIGITVVEIIQPGIVDGVPAKEIGLILEVNRVLDMSRTTVNVFSDSCGAVVIGRSEGEKSILAA